MQMKISNNKKQQVLMKTHNYRTLIIFQEKIDIS